MNSLPDDGEDPNSRIKPPQIADSNGYESDHHGGVILGVDGGATSTVCVCMPFPIAIPESHSVPRSDAFPILSRSVSGCSNHNSVGEPAARAALQEVIEDALAQARVAKSSVRAVCLGVSGVSDSKDEDRILVWLRNMFPPKVKLYVHNDAVAALASGTMGTLKGCVLIAGTGCVSLGFSGDGRQARASGAGPLLGDWGSGYGIAAQALTAVIRQHDGRGKKTLLTSEILRTLELRSADELIGWTYGDQSWARVAALVPEVVRCAEAGDDVAIGILRRAVGELAESVKAVVKKLNLCGEEGRDGFMVVMVGGLLEAKGEWDIGKEVIKCIVEEFPGAVPVRPKVEPAVGSALLAQRLWWESCGQ